MPVRQTKTASQTAAGVADARRWRQGMALLALSTSLALAGCGDGKDSGSSAQTAPPAPAPTPQEKIVQLEAMPLLGGIDADDDGVRDDIALHIERTYSDPVQRRAAMQMARAFQATLLVNTHDHLALREASEAVGRAIACIHRGGFPGKSDGAQGSQMRREIRDMTTNTKERLQAFLAYNKAMSGSVWTPPEGNVCE